MVADDERIEELTGRPSIVVARRQDRPHLPPGCPFCPGGIEAPEPYDVHWFVNRWPPLPDERAEVLLYTPHHDASLATMGSDAIGRVLGLWADRTAALGARPDVAYVAIFENRGPEAGATISHPHCQLYALANIPPVPLVELGRAQPCPLCVAPPDGLVVSASSGDRDLGWRAWVPHAAAWPFELLIAPVAHIGDLSDARATFAAGAAVLGGALAALDRLFATAMPYMLWVHQRPTDGASWPQAHLHVHVAPLWRSAGVQRYVAAGELGTGVYFNPVDPLDAARQLRAALP